tara:strand:+ start:740 stop:1609 length:870 start_codon:yes stop_codon:yes gene_type:complete
MSKKPNVKPLIKPGLFLAFKGKAKDFKGMKDLRPGKKTGPGFSGKKRVGGIMKAKAGDEAKINKVISGLSKASKTHAAQAKMLKSVKASKGKIMKYSSGMSPESAKATAFAKDKLEKLDKGIYETGSKMKGRLAAGIAKVKAAGAKLKEFAKSKFKSKAATKGATKVVGDTAPLAKFTVQSNRPGKLPDRPGSKVNIGKSKALVTANKARAFKVLRAARALTPIGAATVVATSIKKRDPKAVKAEREFFKGKKYEDYGFESMQDYAKPKKKNTGGMVVGKGADYIKDLI